MAFCIFILDFDKYYAAQKRQHKTEINMQVFIFYINLLTDKVA